MAHLVLGAIVANRAMAAPAAEGAPTMPEPPALHVPPGQVLAVTAQGTGVQIYECAAAKDDPARFAWTLKAPEASLTRAGEALGRHYAGPTWEASDGSKVTGEVMAKVDAPNGDSIPWLLLRAKSASGSGIFSHILSVQRLRTEGGKAPGSGCDASQAGKESRIPYSAEYRFYVADRTSPLGVWKTFDDKTGEARAMVRIYEQDGELFGRIERTFRPGGEQRVCVPCSDERKDKPIVGLVIIRHMKQDGGQYDDGDILDPESGRVYRCKMHLDQDGTRLVLRGYLGISLLGRSQTWERQS
jgi:uncharacterized protein (DUF2147 family)